MRIGELARLASTTPRAIRHYHAIGLLPEPERERSNYRSYGAEDLVLLVRIRRLRELGMPLDQIATQLSGGGSDVPSALRSLADDISRQIEDLERQRAKLLALADSPSSPMEKWRDALGGDLPAGEQAAVELIDALRPEALDGMVARASELMSDPARSAEFDALLRRFQALPDDADETAISALASEWVALLPRPEDPPPPVDVDTMAKLIGDRFSPAQLRCLHHVRELYGQSP
jgi:DNA-binding transcriptional MerR regulator